MTLSIKDVPLPASPEARRHLYVFKKPCKGCLFSDKALISSEVTKLFVAQIVATESHFICHVASIHKRDVACKAFLDRYGDRILKVRLGRELDLDNEVDQPPYPEAEAKALHQSLGIFRST